MNAYAEHAHYGFRIIMHAQENPYEPKASGCWSFMMSKRADVLNMVISGTNVPPTVHFFPNGLPIRRKLCPLRERSNNSLFQANRPSRD